MTPAGYTILASILGGLIGGLFTFLGVYLTIKEQQKRDKIVLNSFIFATRPELEITNKTELHDYIGVEDSNISIVYCFFDYNKEGKEFNYNEKYLESNNWKCIEYTFKNTGRTKIKHFSIATNYVKKTSISNSVNINSLVSSKYINYRQTYDISLSENSDIKIQFCFLKNKIPDSIKAPISFWLVDVNNNYWIQDLFLPNSILHTSTKTTYEKMKAVTDEEKGFLYFQHPKEW